MRTVCLFCALIFGLVLPNVRPYELEDYPDTDESGYGELGSIRFSDSDFELAENEVEQEFGLNEAEREFGLDEAKSSDSSGFGIGSVLSSLLGMNTAHAAEIIDLPQPKHWKVKKSDTFETLFNRHKELFTILTRFRGDSFAVSEKEKICKSLSGPAKAACLATMRFMMARTYVRMVYKLVKHGWTRLDIIEFFKMLWGRPEHPLFPFLNSMRVFQRKRS